MRKSYFTDKEHTQIAFIMPIGPEGYVHKVVVQDRKKRSVIRKLVMKNFKDEFSAQDCLDRIADRKGWDLAFTS